MVDGTSSVKIALNKDSIFITSTTICQLTIFTKVSQKSDSDFEKLQASVLAIGPNILESTSLVSTYSPCPTRSIFHQLQTNDPQSSAGWSTLNSPVCIYIRYSAAEMTHSQQMACQSTSPYSRIAQILYEASNYRASKHRPARDDWPTIKGFAICCNRRDHDLTFTTHILVVSPFVLLLLTCITQYIDFSCVSPVLLTFCMILPLNNFFSPRRPALLSIWPQLKSTVSLKLPALQSQMYTLTPKPSKSFSWSWI